MDFGIITWLLDKVLPMVSRIWQASYTDAFYLRIPSWSAPKNGEVWTVDVEIRSETSRPLFVEDIYLDVEQEEISHWMHHEGQDIQGSNSLIPRAAEALPKKFALLPNAPTTQGVLRFMDRFPFTSGEVQVQLTFVGRRRKDCKQVPLGSRQLG